MKTIDETRLVNENLDALEKLIYLQISEIKRLHEENRLLTEANLELAKRVARLEEQLEGVRVHH
jgi:hypothetical protein